LPGPYRQHRGWFPPFFDVAGVHPDEFAAAERLQTFHPTIGQSHDQSGSGAVVNRVAAVAHFRAETEERQHKRDGPGAVKRVHRRRRCAEKLDGFFDQDQGCAFFGVHWGRSPFTVRRSEFGGEGVPLGFFEVGQTGDHLKRRTPNGERRTHY
jgi:hypothetical protein